MPVGSFLDNQKIESNMEITNEKYGNILTMMSSEDEENKVVALTIIEGLNFNDNITKILLLKKHSTSTKELWKEHAPIIYKEFEKLSARGWIDVNKHLTYKQVLKTIAMLKVSRENFDFYWRDFSNYLMHQVVGLKYDGITSIDITINYKDDEQDREPSESV